MEMNYCMQCGTKLHLKHHDTEGDVPFCDTCGAFRYPVFNTAVSMVVTNPAKTKVILIKQYGRPHYILVAGYVNRGEDAEHAAVREVREEIGLEAREVRFNHSHYFAPPTPSCSTSPSPWTMRKPTPTGRWTPGSGSRLRRQGGRSSPAAWPRPSSTDTWTASGTSRHDR